MEARTVLHNGLRILGNLAVEHIGGRTAIGTNRILIAYADAAAAAHAAIMVDGCHVNLAGLSACRGMFAHFVETKGAVRADLFTRMAADAALHIDARLAGSVLLHLARAGASSHADVLHGTTEASLLMALKMRKADHDIGIHERMADLGLFYVFTVLDRHKRLVSTFDTICNDHLAAGCIRREAVLICGVDMLKGVFATAHVQRIAVGEEGLATQLLDDVGNGARVVGTQEAEVSQLAKVNLDGNKLVLKINLVDSRAIHEALEFIELAFTAIGAQVGEIDLGRIGCHGCPSFLGVRMVE